MYVRLYGLSDCAWLSLITVLLSEGYQSSTNILWKHLFCDENKIPEIIFWKEAMLYNSVPRSTRCGGQTALSYCKISFQRTIRVFQSVWN